MITNFYLLHDFKFIYFILLVIIIHFVMHHIHQAFVVVGTCDFIAMSNLADTKNEVVFETYLPIELKL